MVDDYIRREDAKDALQEKVFHNLTDEFYGAMQAIDELPSADVVPVIRCKECMHYVQETPYRGYCTDTHSFGRYWRPDDFCSYGEREE